MPDMTKEKPKSKPGRPKSNRPHQPGKPVRIRAVYLPQVEDVAELNGTTVPEEVNRYVREGLQREGKWPPGDKKQ